MGLARQFGNQPIVCKKCGYSAATWSPTCPKCMGKSMGRADQNQSTGILHTSEQPKLPSESGGGGFSMTPLALLLALACVSILGYSFFVKKEAPPPPPPVESTAPVRHVRHYASHAATVKPHRPAEPHYANSTLPTAPAHSAPVSAPARPMKLWESSGKDDE